MVIILSFFLALLYFTLDGVTGRFIFSFAVKVSERYMCHNSLGLWAMTMCEKTYSFVFNGFFSIPTLILSFCDFVAQYGYHQMILYQANYEYDEN